MPKTAITLTREVISHEHCGPNCDINLADPTCSGESVATLVLRESEGLYTARIVSGFLNLEIGKSHSDEKCLEQAAEHLGSQGLWIGGARMWKVGDKIEVVYRRERSKDGINARAVLWATVTSVTSRRAEWKTDEIHVAEKFFRAQDIPMEGGFSTSPSVHLDYIRRRI